jgi:hypothetical protein
VTIEFEMFLHTDRPRNNSLYILAICSFLNKKDSNISRISFKRIETEEKKIINHNDNHNNNNDNDNNNGQFQTNT